MSKLALALPAGLFLLIGIAAGSLIDTTINDFFMTGTQPEMVNTFFLQSTDCAMCHGNYDPDQEPYHRWANSMMAQSMRDPIVHAAMAIAESDAAFVGDACLRCHTPIGWVEGRSTPTDGSGLIAKDFDGVSCHVCHRMVDPHYERGNPPQDAFILETLSPPAEDLHTGGYIIDPDDVRRGPFDLVDFFYHEWATSPFHRESYMCASCHEVSNPAYERQPDGTYLLDPLVDNDMPHSTLNKLDMFPLERTYSEWLMSDFAEGPIDMGGLFGGNITEVSSCQDCHMPKTTGIACIPGLGSPVRPDLPLHDFAGANTWVLKAIRSLYPDSETHLTESSVEAAISRAVEMLQNASDMELSQDAGGLDVRIINNTGHKLPTGYPEGRRMWLNIRFLDGQGELVGEYGHYDFETADLSAYDTKVYEAKLGISAEVAALTGEPAGFTFHLALANVWLKDNRIPPRGFTNANFESIQAAPVNYTYEDGQYWDDTSYVIPANAATAVVTLYHQTTTKPYIEFLRDAAPPNNKAGQIAYNMWVLHGKSPPTIMDQLSLPLYNPGDLDNDGDCDLGDLGQLLSAFGVDDGGDFDGDGDTDLGDLGLLLSYFGSDIN